MVSALDFILKRLKNHFTLHFYKTSSYSVYNSTIDLDSYSVNSGVTSCLSNASKTQPRPKTRFCLEV